MSMTIGQILRDSAITTTPTFVIEFPFDQSECPVKINGINLPNLWWDFFDYWQDNPKYVEEITTPFNVMLNPANKDWLPMFESISQAKEVFDNCFYDIDADMFWGFDFLVISSTHQLVWGIVDVEDYSEHDGWSQYACKLGDFHDSWEDVCSVAQSLPYVTDYWCKPYKVNSVVPSEVDHEIISYPSIDSDWGQNQAVTGVLYRFAYKLSYFDFIPQSDSPEGIQQAQGFRPLDPRAWCNEKFLYTDEYYLRKAYLETLYGCPLSEIVTPLYTS